MNQDDMNMEDCKASWRANAQAQAAEESKNLGLQGRDAESYIEKRKPEIYAELERIGLENIR